jgi:3,4-dihydroxy 2-butanone 4-phosphate synthase/GTP cyclohydrolase II
MPLHSAFGGDWQMYIYVNTVAYAEHVALVKGDISTPDPVLVRMHAVSLLDDVLGSTTSGRGGVLQTAMRMIGRAGRGAVVVIREHTPTTLSERVRGILDKRGGPVLRDYGIGAQILLDLGIRDMVLLSNTERTIVGLEGYGLTVVGRRPIEPAGA